MALNQDSILVADDDAGVLATIAWVLRDAFPECRVLKSSTGQACLDAVAREHPDILILDVHLPDITGTEICQRLKANETTRPIPILMVTGGNFHPGRKAAALEAGADAYLYKPFENAELAAQVKVMLRIKHTEDSLRGQKTVLEEAVRAQTEELEQHRRALQDKVSILEDLLEAKTKTLIDKDHAASDRLLTMGIAHEINNPSTFIASNLQTFEQFWTHIDKALTSGSTLDATERQRLDFIRAEMPPLVEGMKKGVERISSIIWQMKHYADDIMTNARCLTVPTLIRSTLDLLRGQLAPNVTVTTDIPDLRPQIYGSEMMLSQVLVNLVSNAAHAIGESGKPGTINIHAWIDAGVWIVIEVADNGPGIAAADLAKLFNPFFTTRRGKGGTGLGLFFSQGIVKGHRGSLSATSVHGSGSTFTIRLPVSSNSNLNRDATAQVGRIQGSEFRSGDDERTADCRLQRSES